MPLTRHMMLGIELPQNPLDKHSHTAPHLQWCCCLQSQGCLLRTWSLQIISYCHEGRVSSQNRNDLMRRVMDERRILYFICSGLMSLWLWCRVSHVSYYPGDPGDRVHAMLISPVIPPQLLPRLFLIRVRIRRKRRSQLRFERHSCVFPLLKSAELSSLEIVSLS